MRESGNNLTYNSAAAIASRSNHRKVVTPRTVMGGSVGGYPPPVSALLPGLLAGLGLIVAIGAQNAFVLRVGLARQHVTAVVLVCAASDALLIFAGTAGVGELVRRAPALLEVLRWGGVAYLCYFGLNSLRNAWRAQSLEASQSSGENLRSILAMTLVFTYLNPHVYLDTVLFLGSLSQQYGADRWWFAGGAATGSVLWFSSLGFGARLAAPLMARPRTWRVLDTFIAAVMFTIAARLAWPA